MKRLISILPLLTILVIGCSQDGVAPTGSQSLVEYDEGLNLKVATESDVNPILIGFNMPSAGSYVLSVLNVTGYTVRAWQGTASAGSIEITWDATNADGKVVDVGLYIFELEAGGQAARRVQLLGGLGS